MQQNRPVQVVATLQFVFCSVFIWLSLGTLRRVQRSFNISTHFELRACSEYPRDGLKNGRISYEIAEKLFLDFLPILLLIAGAVLAAPKHGVPKNVSECVTILTEPGNYKLVNNLLDCPGNGVEIYGSDITLNLHGYEIACAENNLEVAGIGVWSPMDTIIRNVTIKNGHVSNCRDGIVLIQTEDSKVMNIKSTGNTKWEPVSGVFVYGTGITVYLSKNNVIMHNHTVGNEGDGIASFESSGNLFKHNTSTGNGDGWSGSGINLSDEHNSRIMCNRVHGNADGILLLNPDGVCRNSWEKNQFGTEIGIPGCIGAPVVLDEKDVCALDNGHDD